MKKELNIAKHDYINIILTMVAYTINYKLGIGKKRLPEIMQAILNNIDSYNTGYLLPENFDIIKAEVEKLGFKYQ